MLIRYHTYPWVKTLFYVQKHSRRLNNAAGVDFPSVRPLENRPSWSTSGSWVEGSELRWGRYGKHLNRHSRREKKSLNRRGRRCCQHHDKNGDNKSIRRTKNSTLNSKTDGDSGSDESDSPALVNNSASQQFPVDTALCFTLGLRPAAADHLSSDFAPLCLNPCLLS